MDQYAQAGGLATEALGAIRTVTALNAQPEVINKYRAFLTYAMEVSILFYYYTRNLYRIHAYAYKIYLYTCFLCAPYVYRLE